MSSMMYLRFPHGTEIHWSSAVPAVGHVVTHGGRRWVVLAEADDNGCPTFVLGPPGEAEAGGGALRAGFREGLGEAIAEPTGDTSGDPD